MSYDIQLVVDHRDGYKTTVFDKNITYNLRQMLVVAGLPDSFWTLDGMVASDAEDLLYSVWRELRTRTDYYEQFNSPNGWGLHKNLLPFIKDMYLASRQHPRGIFRID